MQLDHKILVNNIIYLLCFYIHYFVKLAKLIALLKIK